MSQNPQLCDQDAIRTQLDRLLACETFDASERNKRFLTYVVEETLQGRGDRIKAYSIATSVFGRNESFDPQHDAIVRIEAGRLRRSLEHYYLTSGRDDPIRIGMPVGAYVPSFSGIGDRTAHLTPTDTMERVPDLETALVHRPLVRVSVFEGEESADTDPFLARSISRHVIVSIARFTDLAVIGDAPLLRTEASPGPGDLQREQDADFILQGWAAVAEGKLHVEALLLHAQTERYIWTAYVERDVTKETLPRLRAEVADQIVRAIAQPTGVIFSHKAREGHIQPPRVTSAFDSVLRFHIYCRSFDRTEFEPVRLALEQAILSDPQYAEAFACLSQMYTCSVRFGYPSGTTTLSPLRRALALAQRAIQLSPSSSRGYLALATVYWFRGQVSSALEALETSRELNPNDTEITAELGLRHTLRGNWEPGIALINEAYRQNPALPGTYRVGLSLWHFSEGRYEEALSEAWKIDMPGVAYPYILVAISGAALGRTAEVASALQSLQNLVPDYGQKVVRDLQDRCLHPDLIEKIVAGLRAAGLSVSASPGSGTTGNAGTGKPAVEATLPMIRRNGN